jgi:hypothetical protein
MTSSMLRTVHETVLGRYDQETVWAQACEMHAGFWLGNIQGKNPLVRHKHGWEDNIIMDLKEMR